MHHIKSTRTTSFMTTITALASLTLGWTDTSLKSAYGSLPNVILCMGDDHGWDETGYNGHPHLQTPVLDSMAQSGLRFDRFYAAHPTCSPTRGSVLTGRHPNRYGTLAPNWSIRPEEITIAHVLTEAGYRCGHFGKWHLGPVKASSPTNPGAMGFHEWLSHDNFFEMNPVLSLNGQTPAMIPGESSQVIVDAAVQFIESARSENQPFFVVIWFGSPHEPYSGIESDLALYDEIVTQYPDRTVKLTSMITGEPTKRPLGEVLRERYAEITAMDRAIGSLRNHLRASGVRENTMLWYCGDNGSPAGASITTPLRGQKAQFYEGGIRVPGILEWPQRIHQPQITQTNAVTSDILPTLCEIVGHPLPNRPIDGVSLLPIIDGQNFERTEPIFFWGFEIGRHRTEAKPQPYLADELQTGTTPLVKKMNGLWTRNFMNQRYPSPSAADMSGRRVALNGRHKLVVRTLKDREERELFDLASDPAETTNLAAHKPRITKSLEQQLRQWQDSVLKSLSGADYSAPKTTVDTAP